MRAGRLLALGVAAALTAGLVSRYRKVQQVPAELRAPVLYLSLSVGPTTLALAARDVDKPTDLAPGVSCEEQSVDGIRVYVYRPDALSTPSGALLWIHGGGRVLGTAAGDHEICSRLAAESGCVVVNVDYRLAPMHPFPAALDDCAAALDWLFANHASLGVDPDRVVVGGASAGGGLAAELAQRAYDEGRRLALQLLVFPMLDDRTTKANGLRGAFVWTAASNRFGWGSYLGHRAGEEESRPYAVAARRTDLTGLAPAWIGIGDLDLFYDEDVAYAERLRASGVACDLLVVPGMWHAANVYRPEAPSMRSFEAAVVSALRAATAA